MTREAILRKLEQPDHAPYAAEAERREISAALATAVAGGRGGGDSGPR
jgi:hypothetical protein